MNTSDRKEPASSCGEGWQPPAEIGSAKSEQKTQSLNNEEATRKRGNINSILLIAEPALLTAEQAARMLGISRSNFYSLDKTGRIAPTGIKLGGRRLWCRRELEEWVEQGCPTRDRWIRQKEAEP